MTPNYKYSEGVSLRRDYVKIPDIKGRVTHTQLCRVSAQLKPAGANITVNNHANLIQSVISFRCSQATCKDL